MNNLIFSIIICLLIYLAYVVFVISKPDKLSKFKKGVIISYLVKVYKLDLKKINFKILAHIVSLSIAFIIAVTFYILSFIDNYYFKLVICFIVLILLQLLIYHIIGTIYKNISEKK